MDEKQILLEEWKEIRESVRYFGNKRFTQLTVFITANGFMLDAFFKQPNKFYLQIVGVVLGLLFFAMEHSSVQYWTTFANRGEAIEAKVGHLELMTHYRPKKKAVSATLATYCVYWGFIFLWLSVSTLANAPLPKGAADIAASALKDAQSFAADKQANWSLYSLNWEDASHTYRLALHATNSSQAMLLTVDANTGRVIKLEKLAP